MLRAIQHVARHTRFDHDSRREHRDAVGAGTREVDVVRGDQQPAPLLAASSRSVSPNAPRRAGSSADGRLVHQQQQRVGGERAGDRDALRLAAGELARERVARARRRRAPRAARARSLARASAASRARASARASRSRARVRCSNSACAWNTMPTLLRSARSRDSGGTGPGRSATSPTAIVPRVERLQRGDRAQDRRLAGARDAPSARRSRRGATSRSTPRSTRRVAPRRSSQRRGSASAAAHARLQPPLEPAREARERERDREVDERAERCPGTTQLPTFVA